MTGLRIRPESVRFTIILGVLAALPSISIDINIPSLLAVSGDFQAPEALVGQTITLFMVGFALGQFAGGPLSDRHGRRPILCTGLLAYSVSAAGCALSPTIGALIAFRLCQGIAAGACAVLAFAIIRDLFEGDAARSKRSYVTVVFGLAPMLAPTIGAWIMGFAGWRPIFAVLMVAGLLLLAAAAFGIAESRPAPAPHTRPKTPPPMHAAYLAVLRDRRFTSLAAVNALSYAAMFAYIAGSSVVLMANLHLSAGWYGVFFACTAASLTAGAWVSGRAAAARVPPAQLVWAGAFLAAASATALCGLVLAGRAALPAMAVLLLANLFARGLVAPNAQHLALDPMRDNAGTAAATIGVLQILAGAVASASVAILLPRIGTLGMTAVMAVAALAALGLWAGLGGRARTA